MVPKGATNMHWAGFPGMVLVPHTPVLWLTCLQAQPGLAAQLLSVQLSWPNKLKVSMCSSDLPPFSIPRPTTHPMSSCCLASEGVWTLQDAEGRILFLLLPPSQGHLRLAISEGHRGGPTAIHYPCLALMVSYGLAMVPSYPGLLCWLLKQILRPKLP